MEFSFKDARFFKQCIDAVANMIDEGSFEISKEGIHLRSLDPSQIAMVDFKLPKGHAFSSFDVDETRTLSVNLLDLSKVVARSRPGEKLSVIFDEKEGNKLQLEFGTDSKRAFKLPLLDLRESSVPKEPKSKPETPMANVKIRSSQFKDMLKDVMLVSSHLQLEAEDHMFNVEAHGDSGDLKIENSSKTSKDLEVKAFSEKGKSIRAMYPAEYLEKMSRAAVEAEQLSLEFGAASFVKLNYAISEAQFTYYLAPRVEEVGSR